MHMLRVLRRCGCQHPHMVPFLGLAPVLVCMCHCRCMMLMIAGWMYDGGDTVLRVWDKHAHPICRRLHDWRHRATAMLLCHTFCSLQLTVCVMQCVLLICMIVCAVKRAYSTTLPSLLLNTI